MVSPSTRPAPRITAASKLGAAAGRTTRQVVCQVLAPRARLANGRVRTIVFHGANDKVVHPSNATAILADARAGLADPAQESILVYRL